MTAALAAAALWLNLATLLGWPVSTTHSIVGAIAGFGIVVGGSGAISWGTLGAVVASWVVSPLTGGLIGYLRLHVDPQADHRDSRTRAGRPARTRPLMVAGMLFVLTLAMLFKGLKNLKLKLLWWHSGGLALATAALLAICWSSSSSAAARGQKPSSARGDGARSSATCRSPRRPSWPSPTAPTTWPTRWVRMAAVFSIIESGTVVQKVHVPIWILLVGGVGIVLGLATYGYKVIATVGSKITEVTPSRGFAAEIGAAITILAGSKLGLPLSTTHTLVGAVIGVGFARGMNALNLTVIRNIIASWLLTLPFAAGVCIAIFYLLKAIFG